MFLKDFSQFVFIISFLLPVISIFLFILSYSTLYIIKDFVLYYLYSFNFLN